MNYSELFEKILANPPLYVGNCNIHSIYFYMKGYIAANWDIGNEEQSDPYYGFQSWVAKSCGVSLTLHWSKIIVLFSSDESDAFDRTVELWKEYKSQIERKQ